MKYLHVARLSLTDLYKAFCQGSRISRYMVKNKVGTLNYKFSVINYSRLLVLDLLLVHVFADSMVRLSPRVLLGATVRSTAALL